MTIAATLNLYHRNRRFRFLMAGGFAAGVNWIVRFPLNLIMPFGAAVICATAIGMAVGFHTYRTFVFTGSQRRLFHQLRDFTAVNFAGMAVTALVAVFSRDFVIEPLDVGSFTNGIAHALGIAAGAIVNYIGHATITFRDARSARI